MPDLTPTPEGGEFRANTETTNDQSLDCSVTALEAGGFVVTWASRLQDGSGWGVYAQRYMDSGTPVGSEFRVNTATTSDQVYSSVAGLADGGFVVTWTSDGQDGSGYGIYAQRFADNGTPSLGEFRVNTTTVGDQRESTISGLADGGFVVTWTAAGQDGDGYGVYGQRYGVSGTTVGSEFRVNTATANGQQLPSVAALADGGFVVSWQSASQDGSGNGIYAQRYAVGGTPVGSEFRVNTTTANGQQLPSVAALGDGGFVVTWTSVGQDGDSNGIYAQRYHESGTPAGSEFRVNTVTAGDQSQSSVTALADGGFVVTWTIVSGPSGDVYAQRYADDGTPAGSEFRVNETTSGEQRQSAVPLQGVTQLTNGSLAVTWQGSGVGDTDGTFVRLFDVPAIDPYNGVTVNGTSGKDTISTSKAPAGQPKPGALNDKLYGFDGDDSLDGGAGGDLLTGGNGNDKYTIDNAADVVVEAAGAAAGTKDSMTSSKVDFTLAANVENGTLTGNLALDITGNDLANSLTGNGAANELRGLGGNDSINGKAGDDFLYGGDNDDTLTGDLGNDQLFGDAGKDKLNGGTGTDQLTGGIGADQFVFDKVHQADGLAFIDTILDFSGASGEKDKISLSGIDADGVGGASNGKFAFIGTAAFGSVKGQARWEQSGGDTYVQLDINGDAAADIVIKLTGLHTLVAADFVL